MPRAAALLALTMVVLAGCGSVSFGDPPDGSTPTPTLSPVAVPDETGAAGERVYGPGLSALGVFDAATLAGAHRSTLTERGFVLTRNRTVYRPSASGEPRTLNSVEVRAVVEPGGRSYRFTRVERSVREWPIAEGYTLIGVWYSEPFVRNRFVNDGRVERYWGQDRAATGGPVRDPTLSEDVGRELRAVDLRVVGNTSAGGTSVYRLEGTRLASPGTLAFPPVISEPRNVSMVARVDDRGVVRSYTLGFDATLGEEPVRFRRTYRVSSVGNATVEHPGWLSEANASVRAPGG